MDTFAGSFEHTINDMEKKWPDTPIVYVAVHKLASKTAEMQESL